MWRMKCDPPSAALYEFHGVVEIDNSTEMSGKESDGDVKTSFPLGLLFWSVKVIKSKRSLLLLYCKCTELVNCKQNKRAINVSMKLLTSNFYL